jgi:hypothetical protein
MRRSLLVLALLALPTLAQAADRRVVSEKDGCVVTAGDKNAGGIELLIATCEWDVPAAPLIAAVQKIGSHDAYFDTVNSSARLPDGRWLQTHEASPLTERQATLSFSSAQLPDGGYKSSWTLAAQQEPLADGRVAVGADDGSWEIRPLGEARTQVIYSLRYDPGGTVPAWLTRSFQRTGMSKMCMELRKAAGL